MIDKSEQPILITGCARSGTSMTAGIVHLIGGAFGGELSPPNKNNAKGMFENQKVRNQLIKPFLKSINCDPLGQFPLPDIEVLKNFADEFCIKWQKRIYEIIKSQGYNNKSAWFYKGAKMCLIWPIWHRAFPNAQWIIVRREAEDITNSCLRTSFMKAYRKKSGWLGWVAEHEKRFEEMADAKLNIQEVWPQRMIAGDFTEIQIVLNNLGLEWDLDEARSFVDPGLWRRWLSRRVRHGG